MPTTLDTMASAVSGSVGTVVHSHNQHGPYTRARTIPTDPNTGRQQRARTRWANAAWRWSNILTKAERTAWATYARNTPIDNRLGDRQHVHPFAIFMRVNFARQVPPLGWIDIPPIVYREPIWTRPIVQALGGVGVNFVTVNPADTWATMAFAALILYISPVRPSTINFHASPFRRAKVVRGVSPGPIPALHWFTDPWGTAVGPRRWFRAYVVLADGRVSQPIRRPYDDNV